MSAPPPPLPCLRLGDQREMLERLVTGSPVVFYTCEARGEAFVPVYVSPNAERVMGWPAAAFTDDPLFFTAHLHPDEAAAGLAQVLALRNGERATIDYRFLQPDGTWRWIRDVTESVHDADGRLACLLGHALDATQAHTAATSLSRSEDRYRRIVESSHDGIVVLDAADEVVFANGRMEALLGAASGALVGVHAEALVPEDVRAGARASIARLRTGASDALETTCVRADGTRVTVRASAAPLHDSDGAYAGALALVHDVTAEYAAAAELARTRDRLREAEKLEALGRLAAGVAHDFNNVLSVVSICCETAKEDMRPGDRCRDDLQSVQTAVEAGAALVQQLLDFGRVRARAHGPVDLGAHVRAMRPLLVPLAGRRIAVRIAVSAEALPVRIEASEIGQILMNLGANARDAMAAGGQLRIDVEPDAGAGARRAMLTVADDGGGMDPETCARIFEPFFTTKGERGTGLGLATVHAIVVGAGGTIEVASRVGAGTTFVIRLPLSESPPE